MYKKFYTLLKLSQAGNNFYIQLSESLNNGCFYPWIDKVNFLLTNISEEQFELLKKNFGSLRDRSQLFDKFTELIVATEYAQEDPIFFNDNTGYPDIYFQKNKSYIEVKRLNNSDHQKFILKNIINGVLYHKTDRIDEHNTFKDSASVLNKGKYLVEDAVKKFDRHKIDKATIVLVYSLDINNHVESLTDRKESFESSLKQWYINKNWSYSLKLIPEDLLFKRYLK